MPITTEELQVAAKAMARGNSPGPDGIVAEFYSNFSDLIGEEFNHMIKVSNRERSLAKGGQQRVGCIVVQGR